MPMQNLNVALQWEHTFGDNNTNAATDTSTKPQTQDAVTLGVTYKFAM
jgi:opacity protein-like surface antigen